MSNNSGAFKPEHIDDVIKALKKYEPLPEPHTLVIEDAFLDDPDVDLNASPYIRMCCKVVRKSEFLKKRREAGGLFE